MSFDLYMFAGGYWSAKDTYLGEEPHGWQKEALLEAKSIIDEQKEKIGALNNQVRTLTCALNRESGDSQAGIMEKFKALSEECEGLKREVLILTERSNVLRNVLVTSSVAFAVFIRGIMVMRF
ncbi:unnamed protein product [Microthlaspi erraticum]|uniref:DUF7900 domain-containing protein n=1 Tax=Microthlaspi erraticum TaxID=1685480 RepID=A0A6D2JS52_9BRAS|nr:unnamed protein product [Microthlaspi erraticum]